MDSPKISRLIRVSVFSFLVAGFSATAQAQTIVGDVSGITCKTPEKLVARAIKQKIEDIANNGGVSYFSSCRASVRFKKVNVEKESLPALDIAPGLSIPLDAKMGIVGSIPDPIPCDQEYTVVIRTKCVKVLPDGTTEPVEGETVTPGILVKGFLGK